MATATLDSQTVNRIKMPTGTKAPILKLVDPQKLKFAPYNPPSRTDPANVKDLIESMAEHGQLTPITITGDNFVIEGHRRTVSARELGWESVWAIVRNDVSSELIYAAINGTTRKMSGNDAIGIFLQNPEALPKRIKNRLQNMAAVLGKILVRRMYLDGYSVKLYNTALAIGRYLDNDNDGFIKSVVEWMLDKQMAGMAQRAMTAEVKPSVLNNAIRSGKVLKITATASD